MDSTLQALGGILLKTIPTLLLLLFVHLYLKAMFFRPLSELLRRRSEATEGARKSAEEAFRLASAKADEYENKLREAREGIYSEQEAQRREWLEDQVKQIESARSAAHAQLHEAREALESDTAAAKRRLEEAAGGLADQIAARLLQRRSS